MTLPVCDQLIVNELVERARRLLETQGKWTGNGVHYFHDHGITIVVDTVKTFSIDLTTENVGSYGEVYKKFAGSRVANVANHHVPQALHILRQIMVLDDLGGV